MLDISNIAIVLTTDDYKIKFFKIDTECQLTPKEQRIIGAHMQKQKYPWLVYVAAFLREKKKLKEKTVIHIIRPKAKKCRYSRMQDGLKAAQKGLIEDIKGSGWSDLFTGSGYIALASGENISDDKKSSLFKLAGAFRDLER